MNNLPSVEISNIAEHVPAMAKLQPHRLAVVFPHGRDRSNRVSYTHYTFAQLDEQSDRIAAGLRENGIGRGVRTVLMVTPSLDFFALTFALFKVGATLVMVDPGMGIKNLGKCLAEAEPEAFIGIPKAQLARRLFGWAKKSIRISITVGRFPGGGISFDEVVRLGGNASRFHLAKTDREEIAAILFTSGATGVPKGAVYSHGIFLSQVEMIRDTYGIEPGEIDLPTFPLFALFDPALGMTAIIPDMDASRPASVDPRKLIEAIEDFGVTNMFGSPAVLNRLGRYASTKGIKLPTLRRVLSAGAPVSPAVLERFQSLLTEGAKIYTPYGATESLPVASISSDEILGETRFKTTEGAGICVGRPVERMQVAIVPISDEPMPQWNDSLPQPAGTIGEIAVNGPVVTKAYFNRPQATALAKIADSERGHWHRMGDVGYFDDRGRLWFCGRKAHRVPTADGLMFSIPCEGIFNRHPKVLRTALVGVPHVDANAAMKEPVLCVEIDPEAGKVDELALRRELLAIGVGNDKTSAIKAILFHPKFPVDTRHNAKIDREKLAVWAARKMNRGAQ